MKRTLASILAIALGIVLLVLAIKIAIGLIVLVLAIALIVGGLFFIGVLLRGGHAR